MSRRDFDARWSALAQRARREELGAPDSLALAALARRARTREPEPLPLVEPPVAWALAAVAALVTVLCAPLALEPLSPASTESIAHAPALPPPPRLPPPPQLEAPAVYLAMASDAWRELTP